MILDLCVSVSPNFCLLGRDISVKKSPLFRNRYLWNDTCGPVHGSTVNIKGLNAMSRKNMTRPQESEKHLLYIAFVKVSTLYHLLSCPKQSSSSQEREFQSAFEIICFGCNCHVYNWRKDTNCTFFLLSLMKPCRFCKLKRYLRSSFVYTIVINKSSTAKDV